MRVLFLLLPLAVWMSGCTTRQAARTGLGGFDVEMEGTTDAGAASSSELNTMHEELAEVSGGYAPGGPEIQLTLQPNDMLSNQQGLKLQLIVHDFPAPNGPSVSEKELALLTAALQLTTWDGKPVAFSTNWQGGQPLPPEPDCSQKPCVPANDGAAGWDPARVDVVADLQSGQWYRLALVDVPERFGVVSTHQGYLQSKDQLQPGEEAAVRFGVGSAPMLAQFTACQKEGGLIGAQLSLSEPISAEIGKQIAVTMGGVPCALYDKGMPSTSQSFTCPGGSGAQLADWTIDLGGTSVGGGVGILMPAVGLTSKTGFTLPTPGAKSQAEPCVYKRF
jgi:hypothetical protein